MNNQNKQDIIKLVENSRDAIVCSIDENGFPNAKTMFRRKNLIGGFQPQTEPTVFQPVVV